MLAPSCPASWPRLQDLRRPVNDALRCLRGGPRAMAACQGSDRVRALLRGASGSVSPLPPERMGILAPLWFRLPPRDTGRPDQCPLTDRKAIHFGSVRTRRRRERHERQHTSCQWLPTCPHPATGGTAGYRWATIDGARCDTRGALNACAHVQGYAHRSRDAEKQVRRCPAGVSTESAGG